MSSAVFCLAVTAAFIGITVCASTKRTQRHTDELIVPHQQISTTSTSLLTFDTITDVIKFAQNKNCKSTQRAREKMYFCPSAPSDTDPSEWPCVSYTDLCDLRPDCPGNEDEHPTFCMFHQLRNAEMNGIRHTISELARLQLEEMRKKRHSH